MSRMGTNLCRWAPAFALVLACSGQALAQNVCIPIGSASTPDGRVAGDSSWNGAARIDLDNPGISPTTYVRLRRTVAPDAALYVGLVVNTGGLAPNAGDRIVMGFSPFADTTAALRIYIAPFASGVVPGMSMPGSVTYWRNSLPGWNSTTGIDPNDPSPYNDWMKPSNMRVYFYGGNRWDFEWKIPLGATPDSMTQDGPLYLPPPGSTFRLYFNLLKVSGTGFLCQYPWPFSRPLSPTLNTGMPDISTWGIGSLDQRVACGVLLTWDRIGLQMPPAATDQQLMVYTPAGGWTGDCSGIGPADQWPTIQGPANLFYAQPINQMPTGAQVFAQFNIAPWGSPAPGDWTPVQYPAAAMPPVAPLQNPSATPTVIPPLTQGMITLGYPLTLQQSCLTEANPFVSIQVQLSSPPGDQFTTFSANPVERSQDTVTASRFSRQARIGTKGYPSTGSGPVRMILAVGKEVDPRAPVPPSVPAASSVAPNPAGLAARAPAQSLSDAQLYRDSSSAASAKLAPEAQETLTWVCRAYRVTGKKFVIEDASGNLELEDTVRANAFAYTCSHRGTVERWDSSFSGQGLIPLKEAGQFELDIPPGSAGLVETTIDAEEFRRWGAEAGFGFAIPNGRFASRVNTGGAESLGLEYRLDPMFSLRYDVSAAEFRKEKGGSDVTLVGTTAGARAYLLEGSLRPYVEAGLGLVTTSPGKDGFGLELGAGLRYRISDEIGITAGYRFVEGFVPGPDPCASLIELGVSIRF